jgi:hypothetical protein
MAAKDAYDYLKGLLKRKLEEKGDNDAGHLIDNPDEQNKPLLEALLKEAGIDKMPDVIAAANKVTVICRPHINTAPYLENYQSLLQQSPLIPERGTRRLKSIYHKLFMVLALKSSPHHLSLINNNS